MQIVPAVAVAWFSAQFLKVLIHYIRTKKIDFSLMFASGGMPSSHSASVISLALKIAMIEGIDSSMFAIAALFATIVIYDATHVRHSVGIQAIAFNKLLETLNGDQLTDDEKIRVVLGHTPFQVAVGAAIGVASALIF